MAGQLALDFNHHRVRALHFEGSARNPKVRGFAFAELTTDPADAGEALTSLLRETRFPRDPAACALDSYDCTFREMDLPFTEHEQIEKVLKFEAETHLHLVDIDEVIVDYRKLDDSQDGAHLLVMAYEKQAISRRLAAMSRAAVDPHFADLHLTALFAALEHFGFFQPPVAGEGEDAEDSAPAPSGLVLVLECDHDATHLLVVQDGVLRAARSMRLGIVAPERSDEEGAEAPDDEAFVLEIDHEGGERVGGLPADQYFRRLQREVQRTLFPLGFAETPARLLVLGPAVRDARFLERLQKVMELPVELPRVFDSIDHKLTEEELESANAEGVAALGVALRLLGTLPRGVDFRQEDVRYARRFDQIKVALACAALMAAIVAFLFGLQDLRRFQNRRYELSTAAGQALLRHSEFVADNSIRERYIAKEIDAMQATTQAARGLSKRRTELANLVGGDGSIQKVPSGLSVLADTLGAFGDLIDEIGRLEINRVDLDLFSERPDVQVAGLVLDSGRLDKIRDTLSTLPFSEEVIFNKSAETSKSDGRTEFSVTVRLKPEWSANPRKR